VTHTNFEAVALYIMPPAMISSFFGTVKPYKTARVKGKDYGSVWHICGSRVT